jgi:hypothetical protein
LNFYSNSGQHNPRPTPAFAYCRTPFRFVKDQTLIVTAESGPAMVVRTAFSTRIQLTMVCSAVDRGAWTRRVGMVEYSALQLSALSHSLESHCHSTRLNRLGESAFFPTAERYWYCFRPLTGVDVSRKELESTCLCVKSFAHRIDNHSKSRN